MRNMPCCREKVAFFRLFLGILFRNLKCPNCGKKLVLVNKSPRRSLVLFIAIIVYYTAHMLLFRWYYEQKQIVRLSSFWMNTLAHCFAGAFVAPFGIYPFLATDLVVKQENMSKPRLNDMVIFMAGVLLGNIVGGLLSFIIWGWH